VTAVPQDSEKSNEKTGGWQLMWAMTKKIKGNLYVYAYKTEWKNGKPKSTYVDYLGPKDQLTDAEIKEKLRVLEKTQ